MALERLNVVHGHLGWKSTFQHPVRTELFVGECSDGILRSVENPCSTSSYNQFRTQLPEDGREFQYTLNNTHLTTEQREFYEVNGYLIIPGLIEDDLIEQCKRRFVDLCEGQAPRGNITFMKDVAMIKSASTQDEYLYNKIQDIVWDDVLSQYILHPRILDFVECFTGPNIKAVHSMLINKPPDSGLLTSRHPLHQDLHYFPFRPADRIVATWTALELAKRDNGCLVAIPGSHRSALLQHDYPQWQNGVNKGYHGVKGYENHPTTFIEMQKGETIFFHPLLIHGSGVNSTKGFRKAISCHYAACECYYIDVWGTTQENIAKEVEEMARRRGADVDFISVWRYRSRLVRGYEVVP